MKRRPEKIGDLKGAIQRALDEARYRVQEHCKERMFLRGILLIEALYVLQHGRHEARKDRFREDFQSWCYAIRGKTLDPPKELRIVVSFDPSAGMLLITAIDLGKDDPS